MRTSPPPPPQPDDANRSVSRPWPILALLGLTLITAQGQQVLIAPPTPPAEPARADSGAGTNEVDNTAGGLSPSGGAAPQNQNPFKWGPVVLHPRLSYGWTYGSGLLSQPGQSQRSTINTVSPGISVDLGPHWDVGYGAAAMYYSDAHFKNNIDHNASLHGHTTYEDWAFNLTQSVAITSDPQVETAQQTAQQSYATVLSAGYQINTKLSTLITLSQNLNASQTQTNSVGSDNTWGLAGLLNYQVGPGVFIGLGTDWGYDHLQVGPDTTHEDVNLQFNWQFARKFSLTVFGGPQFRQYLGSGQPSLISPTYGVTLNYQPLRFTTLTLSASRSINDSFYRFQITEGTSVTVGLRQRLLGRLFLGVNAGYSLTVYQPTTLVGVPFPGRQDTRNFIAANLSTSFLKRGTASLSYSKSQNSASPLYSTYSYNSDQVGLSLSYSY